VKIVEWMLGAFIYIILGCLAYAFMKDIVSALAGLGQDVIANPTNFIAMLITLALAYLYKKNAINKVFAGFKEKLSK
jgi:hypothetical protein